MANQLISQITVPIEVEGVIQQVTLEVKDAAARQAITDLGHALYWVGVTEEELTDGATTNPVTVNGESVTVKLGGMASYNGSEFVWNGSAWQEFGKNNFGALAFKSSASGDFTPAGSVNVSQADDTKGSVVPFGTAGSLPTFTVSGETLIFTPGTLPTAGEAVDVVTASGEVTATFSGTEGTVTVE